MKMLLHRHKSVSRNTEPAINLPQRAGDDPELFQRREYNTESSFKIGCISEYANSEHLENSSGSAPFFHSNDFLTK